MEPKQRFQKLIDKLKKDAENRGNPITNEQLADKLDYSREHFQKLYTGSAVVTEKHIKTLFLHFPELGENITLDDAEVKESEISYPEKRRNQKSKSNPIMVPFLPVKAQAGYVKAIDQEFYLDTLEKYALPPGVSPHGAIWRYWEIEGDSMEPVFRPGDIILTSFVHPMDWGNNMRNFYTYVIVTTDRVIIKRVVCKSALEWVLISENEDNYPQQLLPVESIKEVWIYRRSWSTRAEPTRRFEIKV
jgi:phage repressor protein C with HTH and peptisase S24 domain